MADIPLVSRFPRIIYRAWFRGEAALHHSLEMPASPQLFPKVPRKHQQKAYPKNN